MTPVLRTCLENQLFQRQTCRSANLWYHRKRAVLDVGDLVRQLRALEIVGHMAVLARSVVCVSEGAVEPLEVCGLLKVGADLPAFGVIDREHDRVARGAQF